jgi:hypothetical protein
MLGHIASSSAIIDVGDPLAKPLGDKDEDEADRYALELLLGTSEPDIQTNVARFNAAQLAQAVLDQGPDMQIEPGTLALCLAFTSDLWPIANAAMQYIYTEQKPVWQEVNRIAARQLNLTAVSDDSTDYLRKIMGIGDA